MRKVGFTRLAASVFTLIALSGCAGVSAPEPLVQIEPTGPTIDAAQTASPSIYQIPRPLGDGPDGGLLAQRWSMLGREDRAAASGEREYKPHACEPLPSGVTKWDAVIGEIASRAANHRVVIVNESHSVTRQRETTRRLLSKLRPLGFSVLAAETFAHRRDGMSPVEEQLAPAWPRVTDGGYSREPAFGRLVREAKVLGYRLAAYEQIFDSLEPQPNDPAELVAQREAAQASHLAEILRQMRPDERLIVHVGYSHAAEVPTDGPGGRESEWMAARLKALTGIDPLTIEQTLCNQSDGPAFLAEPPAWVRPGQFDMIVSHPAEAFVDHRPRWRREAGDIPTAIPTSLRPTDEPLVIEAFAWGEPFEAVPVDRVFVEPGEDLPLLLPPGRYRVRAVRLAGP